MQISESFSSRNSDSLNLSSVLGSPKARAGFECHCWRCCSVTERCPTLQSHVMQQERDKCKDRNLKNFCVRRMSVKRVANTEKDKYNIASFICVILKK